VQLTASAELREKLERAVDLMRHRSPTGDLAVVIELAMDGLLEKLEKEARGKTARPQRTPRASKPDHVKRSVRREVFERDGAQCTFADAEGHRCSSRAFLELDHIESRALGGSSDASNLRVLCRAHNQLHAEEVFGRENVARQIHVRQRTLARVEMPKTSIAEVTCLGPRRSAVLTHSILRLAG
jgi:5-methylcytosine-specific restriction endonuclease McrA